MQRIDQPRRPNPRNSNLEFYQQMVFVPDDYNLDLIGTRYAGYNHHILVSLHGAGEKGYELDKLLRHGLPKHLDNGDVDLSKDKVIVLAPQLPSGNWKSQVQRIYDLFVCEYNGSMTKSITGLSLGSMGGFVFVERFPDFLLSFASICGDGTTDPDVYANTHIRHWHGTDDRDVPYSRGKAQMDRIRHNGYERENTLVTMPGRGHGIWPTVYKDQVRNPDYSEWSVWYKNLIHGNAEIELPNIPQPDPEPEPEPEPEEIMIHLSYEGIEANWYQYRDGSWKNTNGAETLFLSKDADGTSTGFRLYTPKNCGDKKYRAWIMVYDYIGNSLTNIEDVTEENLSCNESVITYWNVKQLDRVVYHIEEME